MGSFKTGPGSLVLGAPGSEEEFSANVKTCQVEWDVDSDDDIPLLSGGVLAGDDEYTAVLTGELVQDLSVTGISTYSYEHRGEVVPFVFIPNTVEDRQISGEVKVIPLTVGGEVKKRAMSDFEWPCVGEPDLGDVPAP
jgi:hypothetical protein